jgi:hypothetical protein
MKGITLTDLSRGVDKNVSYIHQFVWKGAPKTLPVSTRVEVARMLDLPEDALRFSGEPTLAELTQAAKPAVAAKPAISPQNDVPVFRDDGLIDASKAEEWTSALQPVASGGTYIALWITASAADCRWVILPMFACRSRRGSEIPLSPCPSVASQRWAHSSALMNGRCGSVTREALTASS